MTAVTQCPQCGTRFRVVPDQLKISHGWVRCGKCAEVFNAREALETAAALKAGQPAPAHAGLAPQQVSIVLRQQEPASVITDADNPAPDDTAYVSMPTNEPVSVAPPEAAMADLPAWLIKPVVAEANDPAVPVAEPAQAAEPAVPSAVAVSALQQTVAHWVRAEAPEPEAALAEPGDATSDAVEPMDIDLPIDSVPLDAPVVLPVNAVPDATVSVDGGVLASHTHGHPHESAAEVGFIRQARRQAAWAAGPARAALGALVMFASALLALQVAVHERDRLAAMVPALKPWLIQLCEPIGCEINPFQHIEAVEIVSTELVRAKDGSYRFEMGLRNNAALPVAMPAVELSLTDRNGEAVVRRVVLPGDWVAAPTELTPTSETSLTLKMSLVNPDELRMEGFRAVVFYP